MGVQKQLFIILSFTSVFLLRLSGQGQMPVDQEPHHKVIFKNEYVRLLDLKIAAGDTTLVHKHDAASVVLFLSNSKFGIRNEGGAPVIADVKPGDVVYRAYDEKPVVHSVSAGEGSAFRCMVVEILKHELNKDSCAILSSAERKLNWHEKLVTAYTIHVGKNFELPSSNCAQLLIVVSGSVSAGFANGKARLINTDGFHFFQKQTASSVRSIGGAEATCILLEFR